MTQTITLKNRQEKLLFVDYNYNKSLDLPQTGSPDKLVPALRYALLTSNSDNAKKLITAGANLHLKDEDGSEPIHDAAFGGNPELIELLISKGSACDQVNNLGRTPLCEAVYASKAEAVQTLLQSGANPNIEPHQGQPPIIEAGYRSNSHLMALLISHGADPNTKTDFSQLRSPLTYAAEIGDAEVVRQLIVRKAEVNVHDLHGRTPLMQSASLGWVEIVKILLKNGADINAEDNNGNTALWWAKKDNPDLIKLLIESGARVEASGANFSTALTNAASVGHIDTLKILIKAGASPEPPDSKGLSALQAAALNGKLEAAKFLLDQPGTNFNYQDQETGETVLFSAAQGGNPEILKLLIENNAIISIVNNYKETPLHVAAGYAHTEAMKVLLDHGSDTEAKDKYGITPLMNAGSARKLWKKEEQCIPALQLLIDNDADVNAIDNNGETALFHAINSRYARIIELLIKAGSDIFHRNNHGKNPLACAVGKKLMHPINERQVYQPRSITEDSMYVIILILLKAQNKGLHWKQRESLVKKAQQWRCPEIVRLLKNWK